MTRPAQMRARTIDDYIDLARELYDPERVAVYGPPDPRHVAFAACQEHQQAQEFPLKPLPRRGAFSVALEEAINTIGPDATYKDLLNAVRLKVRNRVGLAQLPNLYVSGGASVHDVFLAGQGGRRDLTIDFDGGGSWWLSAGVVDGIPQPGQGSATEVAFFERGEFDDAPHETKPVASAVVVDVSEDQSKLEIRRGAGALDESRQYTGVITRLGGETLDVLIEADEGSNTAKRVRAHLSGSSSLFKFAERAGQAPSITLSVNDDSIGVRDNDGKDLAGLTFAPTDKGLARLVRCCAHLARWYGLRERSPAGSEFNRQVRIEIVPVRSNETIIPDDRASIEVIDERVSLRYEDGRPPFIQIRLRNESDKRLYVVLLDMTDAFGCAKVFAEWIPAGGVGLVSGGKRLQMKIGEWQGSKGLEGTDYLKAIVANSDFEPGRFNLPALLKPKTVTRNLHDPEDDIAEVQADVDPSLSFWGTTHLEVVTKR
jgi:hypothetical protein